jgi:arginine-tRNA-protein transferase
MTSLSNLKFFATHPHQCSYLSKELATTLFIDPDAQVDKEIYSALADIGFRRSGRHIYRPHCTACNACIAARIPVAQFQPRRKQRQIWNRNQDLIISEVTDIIGDQYFSLFEDYINQRHFDGDMYPPSRPQYDSFLTDNLGITRYFTFSLEKQLLAVVVTDTMNYGLSAIYTFFDPNFERRSLGSFAILWQIEQVKQLGLPYLYLGYWIKECRKMRYKTDYRPVELLINNRWLRLG